MSSLSAFQARVDEALAWGAGKQYSTMVLGRYLRAAGVPKNYQRDPLFDRGMWSGEVLDAIKEDASSNLGRGEYAELCRYITNVVDRPAKDLYPDLGKPIPSNLGIIRNPPAKAQRVIATLERSKVSTIVMRDETSAARFFQELIGNRAEEFFIAAFLDVRNRIVSFSEFTGGFVAAVEVHMQGVFRGALLSGAAGMVTCHNHPSGESLPSDNDRALWQRLKASGELMGIPIIDHLIVTDDPSRFFSLRADDENR